MLAHYVTVIWWPSLRRVIEMCVLLLDNIKTLQLGLIFNYCNYYVMTPGIIIIYRFR